MKRRVLLAITAVVALLGGCLALVSAQAQSTEPTPVLGTWCPPIGTLTAGQDVACKVVTDPVAPTPTTTVPPTTTTTTTTPPVTTTTTVPPVTTTTTTQPPAPAAYPNATNTGVPAGITLTTHSGDYFATTAQVIDAKTITGTLYIRAHGVVVKNSQIRGGIRNDYAGGFYSFSATDTDIGPTSGCNSQQAVAWKSYTLTRVHIHNFGDGPRITGSDVTVRDSYIKTCSRPDDHADGIQGVGGGLNVNLIHNTIDMRGAPDVTASIFMADGSRSAIVRNNVLIGGGYVLQLHNDNQTEGSNWAATGNRIANGVWIFGPVRTTNICGKAGFVWSDNTLVTIGPDLQPTSTVGTVTC